MRQAIRYVPEGWRRARRPTSGIDITVRLETHTASDEVSQGTGERPIPLGRAVDLGLMSEEGYLTPLGYAFWRN